MARLTDRNLSIIYYKFAPAQKDELNVEYHNGAHLHKPSSYNTKTI